MARANINGISINAATLNGKSAAQLITQNADTMVDGIDFNKIIYNSQAPVTLQQIHSSNYPNQTNAPFKSFGSMITFCPNTGAGYFPFRIAVEYNGQGVYIQSVKGVQYGSTFTFDGASWHKVTLA